MGGRERRALLVGPALLVLAVVVACEGGGSSPPSPVAGVANLCQPLVQAKGFRYKFTYKLDAPKPEGEEPAETPVGSPAFALQPGADAFFFGQEIEGSFVNPSTVDVSLTTQGADADDSRLIYIGPDQWVLLGGQWVRQQPPQPIPFPPAEMCNAMLTGVELEGVTPEVESIEGRDTQRYEMEGLGLNTAIAIFGPQSDMGRVLDTYAVTVWLSEDDGELVRVDSRGSGAYPYGRELSVELSLTVSDINAGDITVEPPI